MAPGLIFKTFHFLHNLQMSQYARVLDLTRVERLARDRHSSLLGPYENYKGNEVLLIWLQGSYSKHFIFFITYRCLYELECYMSLGWKGLPWTDSLAYFGQ